jgi:beta-glucosidase
MNGDNVDLTASDFPSDFLWGVATSAYQIEGAAAEGGRSPSIWDTFSHTPGKTRGGETGDVAADHYHRFAEDVALMSEIGVNAYRFSISWSRLIPEGTGPLNPDGVAFYRALCTALIDAGITPVVTLYHWDLPQALADRGGWVNPESVGWFRDYAIAAKEALGDLVEWWTTLNEPWCTAFLGYSDGVHAPGLTEPGTSMLVAHHLMLAHHAAIGGMRRTRPRDGDQLGVVLNLIPAWPDNGSAEVKNAAAGIDAVQNRLFAAAVLDGKYPDIVRRIHEDLGVADRIDVGELAAAVEPIDFLGINYYNINHFELDPGAPPLGSWPGIPDVKEAVPPGHLTDMGWGVEPIGLTWMLNRVSEWAPGLPLMITESGAAYPDTVDADGRVDDPLRREYLEMHIAAMKEAMLEGAEVRGYFVWSLLDNFEWSWGYSMRFGIVRVDFDTLDRTIKESGRWYQRFLAS